METSEHGLYEHDVVVRRAQFGANVLFVERKQSAVRTFLEEFKSPLILILLTAALIALATGALVSGILIICIVVISAVLDFVISFKSQRAAQALAKRVSPKAKVMRSGNIQLVEHEAIVPGDIVILDAGSVIPADGSVIATRELFVNESALTGESIPVEKPAQAAVYMGSGVVSGEGVMRVTAIGLQTKFAGIVSLLLTRERASEFEKGIRNFSLLLTRVIIVLCVAIFVMNAVFKHDIFSSLIFSLALAVGLTPDLLPMIIAVNLSRASIRMAKHGVIVKKLSAIENFGSMDILCTDKTGTLTQDRIAVVKYLNIAGESSEAVLEAAYVSSSLRSGTKSPIDDAIIKRETFAIDGYKKFDEVPFDFERKRDSVMVFDPAHRTLMVTKGAPEAVMAVCRMTKEDRVRAIELFESLSGDGYRVIAVATKRTKTHKDNYTPADEKTLTFTGFIAFIDPPKENIQAVLEDLKKKSIEIKVITGDHRLVAEKIVREVGLISKGTLDAEEIETMPDDALRVRAQTVTIFSRVTPIQKNRIIRALEEAGHTVGYMGDGINDAPALRTADVGISVDNALDVAKESADIVLTTKDIRYLIQGVVEGRRTFANTQKYISMAISSNFGNMISMTGASIILPFLPMLPTQILLNNLLYEASQIALVTDHVDEHVMNRPNPWNINHIKRFMITFGLLSSVFDFIIFFLLYRVFGLSASAFQTGWFMQSFLSQVFAIFFIRTSQHIWKARRPHVALVVSVVVATTIAWYLALTSIGTIFGFTPLPFVIIVVIVVVTLVYFASIELVKGFFYRSLQK